MNLEGKVKVIGAEQKVSESFKKRELVIITSEQYPSEILIEFVQDKTDLLNSISVGQDVNVSINISGRSWVNPQGETKYFNSIKGWRIENLDASQPQQKEMPSGQSFAPATDYKEEEHDYLPF